MRILVIGNFSDRRCGFSNFSVQTETALRRAGHSVSRWDGSYPTIYALQQQGHPTSGFLPLDAADYDVIHVIWHPATLNHYSGCTWPTGPVLSLWDGCPQAWCPFHGAMTVRWSVLDKEAQGYRPAFYPIPDWVTDLPELDWNTFTVGFSGVREDGLAEIRRVCAKYPEWKLNLSEPGAWIPLEDEIRRLAKSTVNVCWYSPEHDDRSGGVMMALASRRPQIVNRVPMFKHLEGQRDLYWADQLEEAFSEVWSDWDEGELRHPHATLDKFSWTRACAHLAEGWTR